MNEDQDRITVAAVLLGLFGMASVAVPIAGCTS